jgi:hypothetical protein
MSALPVTRAMPGSPRNRARRPPSDGIPSISFGITTARSGWPSLPWPPPRASTRCAPPTAPQRKMLAVRVRPAAHAESVWFTSLSSMKPTYSVSRGSISRTSIPPGSTKRCSSASLVRSRRPFFNRCCVRHAGARRASPCIRSGSVTACGYPFWPAQASAYSKIGLCGDQSGETGEILP